MSNLTYNSLNANLVATNMLEVSGHTLNGVSNEKLTNDSKKFPSDRLMTELLGKLQAHLDAIDPDHIAFKDKAVITDPTISPIFEESELWSLDGFVLYDHMLRYNGKDELHGCVRIPTKAYGDEGHYLLKIIIDKCHNSTLTLLDPEDKVLNHYTEPGTYYQEIHVKNPLSDKFSLNTTKHVIDSEILIPHIAVYFIKDKFYQYLTDKIQAIADIDGGGYISLDMFNAAMELRDADRDDALNKIITSINAHYHDENPHEITPSMIGASSRDHTHSYSEVGAASVDHTHTPEEIGASPEDHTHKGLYLISSEISDMISTALQTRAAAVNIVAPMTVADAPLGILPDKFMDENIHSQVQILIPGLHYHDSNTTFDTQAGMISKSGYPNDTLKNLFSLTKKEYTVFPHTELMVSLHYQFHTTRTITGYIMYCDTTNGKPLDWDIYSDFNDFIHHATIPPEASSDRYEFTFIEPVICDTMTWNVTSVTLKEGIDIWSLRIQPVFGDVLENTINITTEPFTLVIPDNGANKTYRVDNSNGELRVYPKSHIEDIPMYIYIDVVNDTPTVGTTYFPPNIGMVRKGTTMLNEYSAYFKYDNISHTYVHPFLGKYRTVPSNTTQIVNMESLYILKDETKPVQTLPGVKLLDIEHIFDEPVVLSEYRLHWLAEHLEQIPDSWSMDVKMEIDGEFHHVVVDSVKSYTKTIVPGVDVIYHYRFKKPCTIHSLALHLRTEKETGICISQFTPYIEQDFYSVPQNTMYHLDQSIPRIYIGKAWFLNSSLRDTSDKGYVVENTYLGKTCTIPINDMEITDIMTTYILTNPYHSKEINCLIRPIVDPNEVLMNAPLATVTDITEEHIHVTTYTTNRFVIDVSRRW